MALKTLRNPLYRLPFPNFTFSKNTLTILHKIPNKNQETPPTPFVPL